ncbi:MAG: DNA-processing protein DprA [Nodosilinea sp.]
MTSDRAYWLAWSQAKGMGPILLKRLHNHFGSLKAAWQADGAQLLEVEGIGIGGGSALVEYRQSIDPTQNLATYEQYHTNFWTPAEPEYPALLFEISDPPPLLFYRGRTELSRAIQTKPTVAMVGTRDPSEYGQRWTRRLTEQLVAHDILVVSGLASGIDRHAHLQALDSGGLTIAVLGTGVDRVYPWANRALQGRIRAEGLLLSEHPNGTPPDRTHFPRRNRIIAGLSRAVVVTEAPARSGALITARLANDYGREVWALPGSLDNPRSFGCLELINQGAQLILDDTTLVRALSHLPPMDAASSISGISSSPPPSTVDLPPLPPAMAEVLAIITPEPTKLDYIVQELARPTGEILGTLVQLELMGAIVQLPGQRYQRS